MPSTIIGAQSGGVPLVSGNPWSGRPLQPTGLFLKNSIESSGRAYVGFSGGLTVTSGGALASGGFLDGFELSPGDTHSFLPLPPAGPAGVFATVGSAVSGRVRLFWQPLPRP